MSAADDAGGLDREALAVELTEIINALDAWALEARQAGYEILGARLAGVASLAKPVARDIAEGKAIR